jgi:1,4-alpha-glucan branching enzyme
VTGYPTDDAYTDSTKYYHGSGLHYWRVTGPDVDIEAKEVYEQAPARIKALDHAGHFIREMASEMASLREPGPRGAEGAAWVDPPLVLACYDTEFFGHGWKEGIYWLELTLRSLGAFESIRLTLPSIFLGENLEREAVGLAETTWGTDRDASTWLNPGTEWIWQSIRSSEARFTALMEARQGGGRNFLEARALKQTARELLLLESSDWPYMVAKDRAKDYAIQRFRTHLERFETLVNALESGEVEGIQTALSEIEEADNLFAKLDLGVVSGRGGPDGPEGR